MAPAPSVILLAPAMSADYLLRTLQWFDQYLAPGDHRMDAPPPLDLDYGSWIGK